MFYLHLAAPANLDAGYYISLKKQSESALLQEMAWISRLLQKHDFKALLAFCLPLTPGNSGALICCSMPTTPIIFRTYHFTPNSASPRLKQHTFP